MSSPLRNNVILLISVFLIDIMNNDIIYIIIITFIYIQKNIFEAMVFMLVCATK